MVVVVGSVGKYVTGNSNEDFLPKSQLKPETALY